MTDTVKFVDCRIVPRGMGAHDGLHGPHWHIGQILLRLGPNLFRFKGRIGSNQESNHREVGEEKSCQENNDSKSGGFCQEEGRIQDGQAK